MKQNWVTKIFGGATHKFNRGVGNIYSSLNKTFDNALGNSIDITKKDSLFEYLEHKATGELLGGFDFVEKLNDHLKKNINNIFKEKFYDKLGFHSYERIVDDFVHSNIEFIANIYKKSLNQLDEIVKNSIDEQLSKGVSKLYEMQHGLERNADEFCKVFSGVVDELAPGDYKKMWHYIAVTNDHYKERCKMYAKKSFEGALGHALRYQEDVEPLR